MQPPSNKKMIVIFSSPMNSHNIKLERQASRRRAKILREYLSGKAVKELGLKYGVTRQRIEWMITKARKEA